MSILQVDSIVANTVSNTALYSMNTTNFNANVAAISSRTTTYFDLQESIFANTELMKKLVNVATYSANSSWSSSPGTNSAIFILTGGGSGATGYSGYFNTSGAEGYAGAAGETVIYFINWTGSQNANAAFSVGKGGAGNNQPRATVLGATTYAGANGENTSANIWIKAAISTTQIDLVAVGAKGGEAYPFTGSLGGKNGGVRKVLVDSVPDSSNVYRQQVLIPGGDGGVGLRYITSELNRGGDGGSSFWGPGGLGAAPTTSLTTKHDGSDAVNIGSGGGAGNIYGGTGGDGANGIVIVMEFA